MLQLTLSDNLIPYMYSEGIKCKASGGFWEYK